MTADLIDRQRLQEYSGGDIDFEQELLDVFVADAQEHLTAIGNAIATQDFTTIAQEAHHLKGSGGNVGADSFQSLAAQLEQAAKDEHSANCQAHLTALQQIYITLTSHIEQWSISANSVI